MALNKVIIVLFFTFVLAWPNLSAANHLLKGSVTCLDCDHGLDLSGIKVLVKCSKVKKLGMAITDSDGSFETQLPSDINCYARILGGPDQLYILNKELDSSIEKFQAHGYNYFTTSKQLNFYKSCPSTSANCDVAPNLDNQFGSSKTIDLPLPREWGLAPTSYYFPFIPIIGIP